MQYHITAEELAEIQEARRQNRDKNVDRRLKALELKVADALGRKSPK